MTLWLSRRGFVSRAGASAAGAWLAASCPELARAAAEHAEHVAAGTLDDALQSLSAQQAATVDAITARIVPSEGAGPGAREARVVRFVDRALAGVLEDRKATLLAQLADFDAAFAATHGGGSFAEQATATQDAFLHTRDETELFGTLRFLTCVGMFALPSYGGNAEKAGWRLIGFEDTHAFTPPFGYYDRDYPGFETIAPRERGEEGAE